MDRHHAVATRFQSEAFENPGALRGQATVEQHGVVHDVAGEDRALAEPLLFQIGERGRRRRQQEVRRVVGDDPVDLLRHPPVEAPEAGLDVSDRDVELRRRQRGGEGGVGVTVRHHDVGAARQEGLLDFGEHLAGLAPVAPRPHPEVEGGGRDPKLVEEDVGHGRIVVLTGVDDDVVDRQTAPELKLVERANEGRHLDELGPCPDDADHLNRHRDRTP